MARRLRLFALLLAVTVLLPACCRSERAANRQPALKAGEDDSGAIPPRRSRSQSSNKPGVVTAQSVFAGSGSDYDAQTVATVTAAILGKDEVAMPDGQPGVLLRIQPGGETMDMIVAPKSYLSSRGVDFRVSEKITVTGSVVTRGNRRTIVPQTIQWRGQNVRLRSPGGAPYW